MIDDRNNDDIAAVADFLLGFMVKDRPPNHPPLYWIDTGRAPKFVVDALMACVPHTLLDNRRFEAIHRVLEHLSDLDWSYRPDEYGTEVADKLADLLNVDLVNWLASSLYRGAYVNEALAEYGGDVDDIYKLLGLGQENEIREIYNELLDQIDALLDMDGVFYRYVARWNLPGCMPDMEPIQCLTFDEARGAIVHELEIRADDDSAVDEDDANTYRRAATEIAQFKEPFAETILNDVYVVDDVGFTIDLEEAPC